LLQRRSRRIDQTFGLQLGERSTDQRAAHAEAGTEFVFRQFGARRQRLLDDGLPQRLARKVRPHRFLAHPTT
jgi:hypothetical protein